MENEMEKEVKKEKTKIGRKILKIVLIIILIAFILVIAHTVRNYIIITNLQSKITSYSNSTNYYTKSIAHENNGTIITMDYYKKDNKEVVFLERNLNGEIVKLSIYNNGERTDTFIETSNSKTVKLNSGNLLAVNIYNYLETENNWQTILGSVVSFIMPTNYNGKDCYTITGFMSSSALSFDKQKVYVEKDTGLYVKLDEGETVTEREYEFNNVNDSIFTEPDISQYTLK